MPSSDPDLRHPSPPSARIAVVLILLVGIATTIWAFYETRVYNHQRAEDEFARRAAVLHSLTEGIIDSYVDALFDLHLVFTLKGELDQSQFTHIAQTLLQHNPGITALEWVPAVPADRRAAVEQAWPHPAGKAFAGFTELDAAGHLVPAGERAEYFPITFIEPLAGNERALGYDLQTGPTRGDLERARGSRQMALSGQIHLVQETQDQQGVVMIWPLYRDVPGAAPESGEFLGFIEAVFRVEDMLETTRSRTWKPESILDMLFVDESEPNPARRILYYRPAEQPVHGTPAMTEQLFRESLSVSYPLAIGGRNWRIVYRPRAGWMDDQFTPLPWVRSAGMLTITLLVAILVYLLGRRSADIAREVAERTAELNESRRLLDSLLHALPGMAFRCQYDAQLKVIYASEGAAELTGYSADDFIWGKVHFRQLIHPDDVNRVRNDTLVALREHRDVEVEYRLITRGKVEKWILARGRGVYADDGTLLFLEGLAIDITANKRAEADKLAIERKLLESQKLESLGLLAGGIAHDFNNILAGILGNANLAQFKLSKDSNVLPHLHKIELATARAAELCQQMLAYSGKSSFLVEPVDLSQLVSDTLPLLHTTLVSRATVHLNLSPHPVIVMADATQLRQIVMNLVLNATDAVSARLGEINLTTGIRAFDHDFLHAAREGDALTPGEYAFVEVRDNGCGMDAATLSRIFDPFFTTKFAGRGLGLAAVRGIVRGHRGALHVVSTPAAGSTFTLLLPVSAKAPTTVAPAAVETRKYSGKALVIDDEAQVREATAGLLVTLGFTVVTADSGPNGFAEFSAGPADFAVVLLDLTMPGMNGEDTLTILRALSPKVPVLLMSGYSESDRAARIPGAGPLAFLQKPFAREKLERKLRDLLG